MNASKKKFDCGKNSIKNLSKVRQIIRIIFDFDCVYWMPVHLLFYMNFALKVRADTKNTVAEPLDKVSNIFNHTYLLLSFFSFGTEQMK